jgi:hypothetical protein
MWLAIVLNLRFRLLTHVIIYFALTGIRFLFMSLSGSFFLWVFDVTFARFIAHDIASSLFVKRIPNLSTNASILLSITWRYLLWFLEQ